MNVLLDTHTLIWANISPDQLSRTAAQVIRDPETGVLVSVASVWEISTKLRLGKFPEATQLERDLDQLQTRTGYSVLAITLEVALRSARLAGLHRDPFDRMIAAQALQLDIPILSADPKLDGFGVRRLW